MIVHYRELHGMWELQNMEGGLPLMARGGYVSMMIRYHAKKYNFFYSSPIRRADGLGASVGRSPDAIDRPAATAW